jgi:hypothetical protein
MTVGAWVMPVVGVSGAPGRCRRHRDGTSGNAFFGDRRCVANGTRTATTRKRAVMTHEDDVEDLRERKERAR